MLKERIQEIFEFTKSESPYRKANKGWINEDIFLDLSPSVDALKQINEDAKVTLFWSPINSLLANIFLVIFLCSILVFTSISFAKGRFDFNLFNNNENIGNVKIEENKVLNISSQMDVDFKNSTIQQNYNQEDLDKSNEINSSDDDLIKVDQKIINKKIDKQKSLIKESESNQDSKILKSKRPKSNFI